MNIRDSEISCGIKQIRGVQRFDCKKMKSFGINIYDPKEYKRQLTVYINREILRRRDIGCGGGAREKDCSLGFMFSDARVNGGGQRFAKWLVKNKLGEVTKSPMFKNYNTGNKIMAWFFVPSPKFVRECLKKKV